MTKPVIPAYAGIQRQLPRTPVFTGVTFFLFLFFCLHAFAQNVPQQHAIAMHGTPRYADDFKNRDYVNPDAPKGGTLRRAEVGTFDNLNPFLITGRVTPGMQEALLNTYDSLMTQSWNEPFTLYALVAKSVRLPPDRSWIEFELDPRARFHDGTPVTTADVKFSFDALKQYGRPNQRRIYKLVARVKTPAKNIIRFAFGPGFDRETALIIAKMPVIPRHYWQKRHFEKTTLVPPLGGGPYKITAVHPGRSVRFERVKNYWAAHLPINRGLYNFDVLHFDFYRDDKAALQALAAGSVDLRREWSAVTWARDYDDFAAVRDGRILRETFKNGRPTRARFFVFNMRRAPFDNRDVRRALAHAFDFEWLNKTIFLGTQTRVDSLFMNSDLADPDKIKLPKTDGTGMSALRQNLRTADSLLQKAGWTVQDGVRRNKNGTIFEFEILLNDPADEKVALEYARVLARLGIRATVRTVDTAQYTGRMSQFDFAMTINFWRNSLSPGTEQAVYWGSAAAGQEGSFNYSGLRSDAVDHAIAAITHATTRDGLVAAARKLDHAVMREWIGVPLFDAPDDRVAFVRSLRHPGTTPLYGPVIESWWREDAKSGKQDGNNLPSQWPAKEE
jgi:microcin C transport system substrate-binding protein